MYLNRCTIHTSALCQVRYLLEVTRDPALIARLCLSAKEFLLRIVLVCLNCDAFAVEMLILLFLFSLYMLFSTTCLVRRSKWEKYSGSLVELEI